MNQKINRTKRYSWLLWLFFFISGLIGVYVIWQNSEKTTIKVEWSTASEIDTAGFNIYRSESSQGPYVKVNSNLIPASGDPFSGGDYSFTDKDILSGQTYYYQLEDVDLSGAINRHGPIQVSNRVIGIYEIGEFILAGGIIILGLLGLLKSISRENNNSSPIQEQ
jgi:hypothetical protein